MLLMKMESLICSWSVVSTKENCHSGMHRQIKHLDSGLKKKAMNFYAVREGTNSIMKIKNYL